MVKGGYQRKNAPDKNLRNADCQAPSEPPDWSFKISNKQLLDITGTLHIRNFCTKQMLQYLAHVCRMDNKGPVEATPVYPTEQTPLEKR